MADADGELLVLLLDTNLLRSDSAAGVPGDVLLQQVLLFLKAHQLLSENNHQCIIALQPNGSPVLYTLSSAAGSAAAMPALVLERVQQLLLETPAAGLQQQPEQQQQQQQQEVALAAGLSRALCYTSRLLPRYAASTRHKAKPRILSLLAGADTPLQYIPVMNCIFAAQHAGVALDACILGAADSAFMQQAAHITGGVYLRPHQPAALLQYLLGVFSADTATRASLNLGIHSSRSSRQHNSSWQVRAEAGAGGGSSGSGGKGKGYSSGGGSSGSGSNSEGGGGLFAAYSSALQQHPLLVKALTTAFLSAIGNLICQVFIEKQDIDKLDWKRINTFTLLGLLWVAPCLHFWYGSLNKIVTLQGNAGALARMACDQLGFAPLFVGSMMAILTALDGKSDKVIDTLKADLPSAIKANWALWVPAQFLNFRFVPAQYQVLFSNVVALAWNVYLSFATRPKTA
ncbi:hypothetical protein OEZ85_002111 [Tetradesmus obliquus]|uniref:General transcription and DNA repair factor IIH subunit TFB4 n=1 Tax=Tetradesmus obliquus TaxID=3088 RepID=A0ABY8U4U3_TETOB|nr:hypothetical protein OEZ85_002111 [Tetradesmus obliquus]